MPRLPRLKPGMTVAIQFHDHVQDDDNTIEFIVYGRVVKSTAHAITVDSWALVNPDDDRNEHRQNIVTFTILRKVISRVTILDPPS